MWSLQLERVENSPAGESTASVNYSSTTPQPRQDSIRFWISEDIVGEGRRTPSPSYTGPFNPTVPVKKSRF
ncbi:uncharacterized protein BJX67DRAFT_156938 [Aspergillus lucknowensis]|uniref:Uncharacterized protein n=1 Tax=Aspergillus lucknowensis TaxID=176173 RepID=A0ABR4LMU5_9EURO